MAFSCSIFTAVCLLITKVNGNAIDICFKAKSLTPADFNRQEASKLKTVIANVINGKCRSNSVLFEQCCPGRSWNAELTGDYIDFDGITIVKTGNNAEKESFCVTMTFRQSSATDSLCNSAVQVQKRAKRQNSGGGGAGGVAGGTGGGGVGGAGGMDNFDLEMPGDVGDSSADGFNFNPSMYDSSLNGGLSSVNDHSGNFNEFLDSVQPSLDSLNDMIEEASGQIDDLSLSLESDAVNVVNNVLPTTTTASKNVAFSTTFKGGSTFLLVLASFITQL